MNASHVTPQSISSHSSSLSPSTHSVTTQKSTLQTMRVNLFHPAPSEQPLSGCLSQLSLDGCTASMNPETHGYLLDDQHIEAQVHRYISLQEVRDIMQEQSGYQIHDLCISEISNTPKIDDALLFNTAL